MSSPEGCVRPWSPRSSGGSVPQHHSPAATEHRLPVGCYLRSGWGKRLRGKTRSEPFVGSHLDLQHTSALLRPNLSHLTPRRARHPPLQAREEVSCWWMPVTWDVDRLDIYCVHITLKHHHLFCSQAGGVGCNNTTTNPPPPHLHAFSPMTTLLVPNSPVGNLQTWYYFPCSWNVPPYIALPDHIIETLSWYCIYLVQKK